MDFAQYEGGITVPVVFSCIIAASSGFIYGYDLVIAGGVSNMNDFLEKFYPKVLASKLSSHSDTYCKYNSPLLQFFTSSLYMGALLSTFLASVITRKLGRRRAIMVAALLFDAGAALSASAHNLASLLAGRILIGFGIGFANQAVPVYLSEVAPAKWRGGLNLTFSLNLTIGIFSGNIVNYATSRIHPWGWRLSLGLVAVPALILTVGSLILVESPNCLIDRGHPEQAKMVLRRIRGTDNVEPEFSDLVMAKQIASHIRHPFRNLFLSRKNRPQLVMAFAFPFFQQVSGNDGILFYGPFLFKIAGFKDEAALYSAVIIGATVVTFTFISMLLVDRVGRRPLLLLPTLIMFITQVMVGSIFATRLNGGRQSLPHREAMLEVTMVCLFSAAFACSWGPLGWLVPSEIFPLETRSAGQSVAVFTNMTFKFIIAQTFLSMLCVFKYGIFLFFASWVAIMGLFTFFLVPETKGVPIEEMHILWAKHWFWKRVVPSQEAKIEMVPRI